MAVLLNQRGLPEPPPSVVARLKEISPLLELKFLSLPVAGDLRWWWGVRSKWRDNDPRWQMVLTGEVPPDHAYDLVTQLPPDCTADDAVAYLQRSAANTPFTEHKKFLRDIADWNQRQQDKVIEEGGEHMAQLVKDHITEVANVTKVYQNDRRRGKRAK